MDDLPRDITISSIQGGGGHTAAITGNKSPIKSSEGSIPRMVSGAFFGCFPLHRYFYNFCNFVIFFVI